MALAKDKPRDRVPVTVIGGYLGAGKTTLINRLLAGDHGLRLAVLVNDFGAINIDADLIADHDGQTLALTNGCVCCSIADDLGSAFATISALTPHADHIVLEASGVADPGRIANYAFGTPGLDLDSIVVLADCETLESHMTDRFVGATVRRQLAAADLLFLTKTDLADTAQVARTADRLRRDHPDIPILHNSDTAFRWGVILGANPNRNESVSAPEIHDHQFGTASWRKAVLLDRSRFIAVLRSQSGPLLRCKGWVRFDDTPDKSTLVQMVGNRIELTDARDASPERKNGLTFIFLREALSAPVLCDAVSACQSSAPLPQNV